jgi:prophage tail gpP-like protein
VYLGADLVLTGYCDVVEPRIDKSGDQIPVALRSKTADLVDCSVDAGDRRGQSRRDGARPIGMTYGRTT